ncbi:hypothetical protein BJP08_00145 [Corynebacterium sp. NML140438]|uniref:ATP-dependent nuclease n=1 Tax=Corynebacterium sp. NML140438 TaxID=1906334 RepID=UPI0008FB10CD|nr:ATP-binding protein [Corynebacterium sp. NML140438]OIR46059.1 hypothetical protein BJP08_00145 [Corynebacterium sp. NML140438]
MIIKNVAIKGFRGALNRKELMLEQDFTVITGRNDAGKSTFLDALNIFFGNQKVSDSDFSRSLDGETAEEIYIEVSFCDLPQQVVFDSTSSTTFEDEYLLDEQGYLTIRYTYTSKGRLPKKSLLARHPVLKESSVPLLSMKNAALKKLVTQHQLSSVGIDMKSNVALRQALYKDLTLFEFQESYCLELENVEGGKGLFSKIERNFPAFHLFRAENVSDEGEKFVQDPVRAIVKEVLEQHVDSLDAVAQKVDDEITNALTAVSDDLAQLAPSLRTRFMPHDVRANWEKAYASVAFSDAQGVPLATRGSGMRRLALLSFFRVQAERVSKGIPVVYAIEEPEAFLHPDLQKEIWQALNDLALHEENQLIITSHSANLIEGTLCTQVRYLDDDGVHSVSPEKSDDEKADFVRHIEKSLGKFRDTDIDCFILVEGKNDITTLEKLLPAASDPELITFAGHFEKGRIKTLPIGGTGAVGLWQGRLDEFDKPVVFLRDADDDIPELLEAAEVQNGLKKKEVYTIKHSRREMENFLSLDVIIEVLSKKWNLPEHQLRDAMNMFGVTEDRMATCNVPDEMARSFLYCQLDGEQYEDDPEKVAKKSGSVKRILADAFAIGDQATEHALMSSNFGVLVREINKMLA